MKLVRKGTHRGVIGVESAIVMIAFVIVAASLAFVVLNMGFGTSQKAKTTISSGLAEASSSMQVSGTVVSKACETCPTPVLNVTMVPLKIGSGGESVNLQEALTQIRYLSNSVEYADIYIGALTTQEYKNPEDAFTQAVTDFSELSANPMTSSPPSATVGIVYWAAISDPKNAVLENGEHAVLAIAYGAGEQPGALDTIQAEIVSASGAPLSLERKVPQITTDIIDLG